MSGTTRFDWAVPAKEWEKLLSLIDRERTVNDRYKRQYLESVMEEFVGNDRAKPVEEKVRRIARAAGRSVDPQTKRINDSSEPGSGSGADVLASDALANQEKVRVSHRIFTPLLESFTAFAKKHTPDQDLGVVLGLAIREYAEARRIERVDRMLAESIEDIEKVVDMLAPGADKLKGREKKLVKICHELDLPDGKNMHRETVTDAITEHAGETVVDWYLPRVLDRLGRVEHPSNPDIFIHESQMERLGVDPDAPAHDRKPVDALTSDERRNAIAIELARASRDRQAPAAKSVKAIHRDVFDGERSRPHIRQMMNDVAGRDGFRWLKYDDRANKLQGKVPDLDKDGPAYAALQYDARRELAEADEPADEPESDPESDADAADDEPDSDHAEIEQEAADRLNDLSEATAVTVGARQG